MFFVSVAMEQGWIYIGILKKSDTETDCPRTLTETDTQWYERPAFVTIDHTGFPVSNISSAIEERRQTALCL